ncbi:hypothetical protein BH09MYX1_BH09MYX1_63870 [soil metagenome]
MGDGGNRLLPAAEPREVRRSGQPSHLVLDASNRVVASLAPDTDGILQVSPRAWSSPFASTPMIALSATANLAMAVVAPTNGKPSLYLADLSNDDGWKAWLTPSEVAKPDWGTIRGLSADRDGFYVLDDDGANLRIGHAFATGAYHEVLRFPRLSGMTSVSLASGYLHGVVVAMSTATAHDLVFIDIDRDQVVSVSHATGAGAVLEARVGRGGVVWSEPLTNGDVTVHEEPGAVPAEMIRACTHVKLTGTRSYHSGIRIIGEATFATDHTFAVPDAVYVTEGSAGNKRARVLFSASSGDVTCEYRGAAPLSHPLTASDVDLGRRYTLEACEGGLHAGDPVVASHVTLSVTGGDKNFGRNPATNPIEPDEEGDDDILDTDLSQPPTHVTAIVHLDEGGASSHTFGTMTSSCP